jgi:hypothetical protein
LKLGTAEQRLREHRQIVEILRTALRMRTGWREQKTELRFQHRHEVKLGKES